jgi:hypothetical protein
LITFTGSIPWVSSVASPSSSISGSMR